MNATVKPLEEQATDRFKEFLIFRVDDLEGGRELADESALKQEAVRYADLVAEGAPRSTVHYEVCSLATQELLYSTEEIEDNAGEAPWTRIAT